MEAQGEASRLLPAQPAQRGVASTLVRRPRAVVWGFSDPAISHKTCRRRLAIGPKQSPERPVVVATPPKTSLLSRGNLLKEPRAREAVAAAQMAPRMVMRFESVSTIGIGPHYEFTTLNVPRTAWKRASLRLAIQ